MAKQFGHAVNTIVPQSDFDAKQNENGGWQASQSFRVRKGDLSAVPVASQFPIGAALITLDPNCETLFAYLRLSRYLAVSNIEGGWTQITCEFVGFSGAASTTDDPLEAPVPTYSKRGTLYDAPLNEHPKWKALSNASKNRLGWLLDGTAAIDIDSGQYMQFNEDLAGVPLSGAIIEALTWEVATGDELEFARRIAQGITTYKLGTYEYTHRWEDNVGISAAQMNLLGKISTPSGSPPTPGTGRNWLMTGANEEQHGSGNFRFTNELTYLLSDEDGHDSFLQS